MPEKPLIPPTEAADKSAKTDTPKAAEPAAPAKPKPLDGITSIDDKVFLECEILAHASAGKIADQIATEAVVAIARQPMRDPAAGNDQPHLPRRPGLVILLDDALISALQIYSSLQLQLALFEKGFDGVAPAAAPPGGGFHLAVVPGLAIATVAGAVQGITDLLALFRQDTQFSGRSVTIKETALYLDIARALLINECDVLYPRLLSFQASEATQLSQTVLSQLFDGVFRARRAAADRLRPLLQKVAELEQALIEKEREFAAATPERQKQLTPEIQDLKDRLVSARKNLDPDLVLFENTDAAWTQLQKSLAASDDKTGVVPMQMLSRAAEAVERFKVAPRAFFLYAEGVVAGGTMRITHNLWQTLFGGDGLMFSGGAIVAYALFDGEARVISAATHRHMSDFRKLRENTPEWENPNTVAD